MFSQLVTKLRRIIIGRSTVEALLEDERLEANAAALDAGSEPQQEASAEPEWIRTHTLDAPIMPVEEMRWLKRRRALLNYGNDYGNGDATESDLACLSPEERERLEAMEVQVRWGRFLEQATGVEGHRHATW
ncbi:MAG: hypothetical protein WAT51_13650 [Holophaga sp.]